MLTRQYATHHQPHRSERRYDARPHLQATCTRHILSVAQSQKACQASHRAACGARRGTPAVSASAPATAERDLGAVLVEHPGALRVAPVEPRAEAVGDALADAEALIAAD